MHSQDGQSPGKDELEAYKKVFDEEHLDLIEMIGAKDSIIIGIIIDR